MIIIIWWSQRWWGSLAPIWQLHPLAIHYRNPNDMCTANFHLSSYLLEVISKYIRPAMLKKNLHTLHLPCCQSRSTTSNRGWIMIWSMDVLLYSYIPVISREPTCYSADWNNDVKHIALDLENVQWIYILISEWSKAIYFSILHILYFCLFILPWYLPNMFRGTDFYNDKHSK